MKFMIGLVLCVLSSAPLEAEVHFLSDDFESVLQRAKREGRDVFIYFWTEWCAPCKQMDDVIFSDPELSAAINEFLPLRYNAEAGEGDVLRDRYKVEGYPFFLFVAPNGEELGRIVGTRGKTKYLRAIETRGRDDPGRPAFVELEGATIEALLSELAAQQGLTLSLESPLPAGRHDRLSFGGQLDTVLEKIARAFCLHITWSGEELFIRSVGEDPPFPSQTDEAGEIACTEGMAKLVRE